jgi:plasmid stabilization system protein ParE
VNGDRIQFHPLALSEAEAAIDWYAQRSKRAASVFVDELEYQIEKIAENPRRYAVYELGTRRLLMRRFPFRIVFRETDAGVEVIAVAHGRRRPGYWRERVG